MVIFHSSVKLPEGNSHKIPLNHHVAMVFIWFSYDFPMQKMVTFRSSNHRDPRLQERPGHPDATDFWVEAKTVSLYAHRHLRQYNNNSDSDNIISMICIYITYISI